MKTYFDSENHQHDYLNAQESFQKNSEQQSSQTKIFRNKPHLNSDLSSKMKEKVSEFQRPAIQKIIQNKIEGLEPTNVSQAG